MERWNAPSDDALERNGLPCHRSIVQSVRPGGPRPEPFPVPRRPTVRSEEHTSELQSLAYLVCRLLLEKKKPLVRFLVEIDDRVCVIKELILDPDEFFLFKFRELLLCGGIGLI